MNPPLSVGETLFIGDWESLGMVHLEIPADELQPTVPFELDMFEGKSFVSLVFFTMRNMRLACGPRILDLLFYPFREQRFLNVRTYVRHRGERGIHFIAEWISNPICVRLGPALYSLPYRHGNHRFQFNGNMFATHVTDLASRRSLACHIKLTEPLEPCEPGTLDEFLFERYAAFNAHRGRLKSFRVSHEPWEQCHAEPAILDDSLLRARFPWFASARTVGANYSPGVRDVRMGWPRVIWRTGSFLGSEIPAGSDRTPSPWRRDLIEGLHRGELQAKR